MIMPFIFKPAAQRELDQAFDWYEKQETGLGDRFAEEVRTAARLVCEKPDLHPIIYRDVRAQRVRIYPYRLIYRVRAAKIICLAVHHDRNDPEIWRRRV